MILVLVPAPELVIMPALLTLAPDSVIAFPAVASSVRSPVPVMPPLRARVAVDVDNFRA